MANRLDDFGKVSAEAARKLASKQAEAAGRYVAVLSDFGRARPRSASMRRTWPASACARP
jgi:hypothetical protein